MRAAGRAQRILAAGISRAVMRNQSRHRRLPMSERSRRPQRQSSCTTRPTQFIGDVSGYTTYRRVQTYGSWPDQGADVRSASHVEFYVSLSRAGSHRGGGDRAAAWPDQYDARRLAQPLAKADAAARAASVRRHHCDHGDDLGPRPLVGEDTERALTSLERRAYTPLFLSSAFWTSFWPRNNRPWRLWRNACLLRKPARARWPAGPGRRLQSQSSVHA